MIELTDIQAMGKIIARSINYLITDFLCTDSLITARSTTRPIYYYK